LQGRIFPELRNQVIPPRDKIVDHENTEWSPNIYPPTESPELLRTP
jgi:hypothetical protein